MIDTKEATHLELRLRFTDAIVCIDVDGHKENGDITLDQFWKIEGLREFFKSCPYTLSRKKKLPHFFVKLDDLDKVHNSYIDCFNIFKGDILINHVWEKKDTELFNYNNNVAMRIVEPVIKPASITCQYLNKGIVEVQPEGRTFRHVDLGDGSCDADATVTIDTKQHHIILK